MDLNKVLESFARGEINKEKAREVIQTLFKEGIRHGDTPKGDHPQDPAATDETQQSEPIKRAFEKMKKSRNLDEFFKASSGMVQQIADTMPGQFEKLQHMAGTMPGQFEKLQETYLQDMNFAGLSVNIKGITSKFSLFRSFSVSDDCAVSENQAVGCQWFAVSFADKAQVHRNKFTAVQVSEMGVDRSNLTGNHFALSRLSNVTLRKARIDDNRVSRSTLSDVAFADSDFVENRLSKSEFAQTAVHSTRMARNGFTGVTIQECDFDACDLQGIEFENCRFEECSFVRVEVRAETPVKIADRTLVGRTIQDCRTIEALLAALGEPATNEKSTDAAKETKSENARTGSATPATPRSGKSRPGSENAPTSNDPSERAPAQKSKETQAAPRKPAAERSEPTRSRAPRSK